MNSDDLQKQSDDKILLADDVRDFMKGPIYTKFMRAADRGIKAAMEVVRETDPFTKPGDILRAQEALRQHEKFPNWLIQSLVEGEHEMQLREGMEQQARSQDGYQEE